MTRFKEWLTEVERRLASGVWWPGEVCLMSDVGLAVLGCAWIGLVFAWLVVLPTIGLLWCFGWI
ncbi:hypothetical protein [Ancylobacter oerskovii]|uniref:Uncharacterized protein n=1 Tax=Ancylobacter oerskovii TaxID=459519 RepID=A0ABW4Z1M5_9HYPH|nr:hypothetical protein [Ancylobacter oerskovii]MBS7545105.1 hypothetical protein [Ancylobacter oerskovii]